MSRLELQQTPEKAAPVFAALGDVTRLGLLSRLNDGQPRSIIQLAAGTGQTRQGVSKHLLVLEQAGMVSSSRVGREKLFLLQPAGFAVASNYLKRAADQWDDALARLNAFVKNG